ncbi:PilZ domain-containing protein [Novosphingobium bradum]|uniref:PilZ domain-containing protein n=1 Tax=Novosphingobium bradum TaxID=1737444 RepID=A0ABV7INR3_9SPHN
MASTANTEIESTMAGEAGPRDETEERRARRLALAMPARCRMLSGFTEDVVVRDVSPGGCRIASHALRLRAGERVLLRPAGLESLPGVVRWCEANEAGIEFDHPLHVAVAEHLHRRFITFLGAEVPYRSASRRLAA